MNNLWNTNLSVAQVRIARPTDQLREIERFYCEGVGLEKSDPLKDTKVIVDL